MTGTSEQEKKSIIDFMEGYIDLVESQFNVDIRGEIAHKYEGFLLDMFENIMSESPGYLMGCMGIKADESQIESESLRELKVNDINSEFNASDSTSPNDGDVMTIKMASGDTLTQKNPLFGISNSGDSVYKIAKALVDDYQWSSVEAYLAGVDQMDIIQKKITEAFNAGIKDIDDNYNGSSDDLEDIILTSTSLEVPSNLEKIKEAVDHAINNYCEDLSVLIEIMNVNEKISTDPDNKIITHSQHGLVFVSTNSLEVKMMIDAVKTDKQINSTLSPQEIDILNNFISDIQYQYELVNDLESGNEDLSDLHHSKLTGKYRSKPTPTRKSNQLAKILEEEPSMMNLDVSIEIMLEYEASHLKGDKLTELKDKLYLYRDIERNMNSMASETKNHAILDVFKGLSIQARVDMMDDITQSIREVASSPDEVMERRLEIITRYTSEKAMFQRKLDGLSARAHPDNATHFTDIFTITVVDSQGQRHGILRVDINENKETEPKTSPRINPSDIDDRVMDMLTLKAIDVVDRRHDDPEIDNESFSKKIVDITKDGDKAGSIERLENSGAIELIDGVLRPTLEGKKILQNNDFQYSSKVGKSPINPKSPAQTR